MIIDLVQYYYYKQNKNGATDTIVIRIYKVYYFSLPVADIQESNFSRIPVCLNRKHRKLLRKIVRDVHNFNKYKEILEKQEEEISNINKIKEVKEEIIKKFSQEK